MLKGNTGEWLELYAAIKILADGRICGADKQLNPLPEEALQVLQVIRSDFKATIGTTIDFIDPQDQSLIQAVPPKTLATQSAKLFKAISQSAIRDDSEMHQFLEQIGCKVLKAKSQSKRDLTVQVLDPHTGTTPEYGFSVKSDVKGKATLLNASEATNLIYQVKGLPIDQIDRINAIDTHTKIKDRLAEITRLSTSIDYVGFDRDIFRTNLQLIDDGLPRLVAQILLQNYVTGVSDCADLIDTIAQANPYDYPCKLFYQAKFKRFLRAVALGLMPAQKWTDLDDATGGYLLVKKDGEIVAFYIYNRKLFDDYLYYNTRLEHPSTTKHKYLSLYTKDDKVYLKLNLQIRFK